MMARFRVNRYSDGWREVFKGKPTYCGFCKGDLQGYFDESKQEISLVCDQCGKDSLSWAIGNQVKHESRN